MAETITPNDVSEFIRLRKARAELVFKKEYFLDSETNRNAATEVEKELVNVESQLSKLESKFKAANFSIISPNESKISVLNEKIYSYPHSDIASALRSKSGPLYSLLLERGELIKQNFEARDEIGKINVIAYKLGDSSRDAILAALKEGKLAEGKKLEIGDDGKKRAVARIFKRLGIIHALEEVAGGVPNAAENGMEETEVNIENKKVWVPSGVLAGFNANTESIRKLHTTIQLKNAERQIRKFDEAEEKDFEKTQHDFLALLKQRDEFLKGHIDECKESVVVG